MNQPLPFFKMNGAGNDFVMIDNRESEHNLSTEQIAKICDRHRGVGADGLLAVETTRGVGEFRMRYYNADGGEAEMCGNGARCFARFVNFLHQDTLPNLSFETGAGLLTAEFIEDQVRINMSAPHDLTMGQELVVNGVPMLVHSINTGVPHAVILVDDLAATDVQGLGSAIRYHEAFSPKGTNVNFVEVVEPGVLKIRTYERGVEGETLACGTGMVACALIHHELIGAGSPVQVSVKGGDTLQVGFDMFDGIYEDVTLHGPADFVFIGEVAV